jgi:membrane glycosyltransferase
VTAEATRLCRGYLARLPLSAERKRALLEPAQREPDPVRAMTRLHHALGGGSRIGEHPALGSLRRRLELAVPGVNGNGGGRDHGDAGPVATTPPVHRTPMAPAGWPAPLVLSLLRGAGARLSGRAAARRATLDLPAPSESRRVTHAALVRRTIFTILALIQTGAFAYYMTANVLPYQGQQPIELAILSLFTILFTWVSVGFWTALSGFVLLCIGGDRHAITRSADPAAPIPPEARTAVIMPICNEHVARVFAGVRATYESVVAAGARPHFDFFILSDSNEPDTVTAEQQAWLELCAAVGGFGHIFYRWRRHRIKRKSGNVADFCRRWGNRYRYMVVLDADSVMTGECLTALVRLMEANPATGIIQTAPRAAGRETLYARIQQFATRVYGPLFTAGLHFWQLGESYYWGHNAIIRTAPFMRHCALGRLPGRGPLSGEILSHDFVEAALMRRAGWKVWMAYDLPGSYEEMPPNLLDELKRDRRWCQGNLINARVFLWEGLHPAHRALFMTGIMAYASAPLWLLSLAVSTAFVMLQTLIGPQYFVQPRQLFPIWPQWDVHSAVGFAIATGLVLFLPKMLGAALVLRRGAARFGGGPRVALSLLLELLFSALLAPVRMLFHTQFVIAALTGWRVRWKSPPREDAETTWGEAVRRHGLHTVLGLAWGAGVYWLHPPYAWWLAPLMAGLALSIPISVYSSRVGLGRALRRARLFLIPEESEPPAELRRAGAPAEHPGGPRRFVDVVVDPLANAIACAASAQRGRRAGAPASRERAIVAAVERGPDVLTDRQKLDVLTDPVALSHLHFQVWTSPAAHATWWTARAAPDDGLSRAS